TRLDLRTRARSELNDAGGTPLWVSAELDRWILEGLRQMGRDGLGRELSQSIMTVASQAAYTLASDVVQVLRVEHPSGYFRKPVAFAAGDVAPGADFLLGVESLKPAELQYDVFGGQVILSPAPDASGQTVAVRYRGAYTEPTVDGSVLDVALRDEDALLYVTCARALAWIGMDESKRQRFERQRGASPVTSQRYYEQRYRDHVRQRRDRVASGRLAIRG
ncbi:MAG: hypothetical protein ACRD1K_01640, partial [Acidimicrobiales bacterium]